MKRKIRKIYVGVWKVYHSKSRAIKDESFQPHKKEIRWYLKKTEVKSKNK